ncbi:MAG: hypothetical protein M1828_002226 [Chrysothrix sp. TS-e1954]|nr:MAG: hypothetical protein M1828_002226 [Chrysothrix sp. TS-e1954]
MDNQVNSETNKSVNEASKYFTAPNIADEREQPWKVVIDKETPRANANAPDLVDLSGQKRSGPEFLHLAESMDTAVTEAASSNNKQPLLLNSMHNKTVQLRYIQWEDKFRTVKPYELLVTAPEGVPYQNFELELAPAEIMHDIRGEESKFTLEQNGFMISKHAMTLDNLEREAVALQYFPQVEQLLRAEIEDVDEVFIFDWRLRSSDAARRTHSPGEMVDIQNPTNYLGPVQGVHIDQSPTSALKRVHHHMGARGEELSKKRFRIIK